MEADALIALAGAPADDIREAAR